MLSCRKLRRRAVYNLRPIHLQTLQRSKINGARHVGIDGSISQGDFSREELLFGAEDTCKSFPSGHTYCAAITFALICLPDLFESFKKRWVKAICWTVPAAYTLTVAISRIVVGAHYLSDVLVGGTLAFTLVIVIREVLILNCAHFKAFKKQPDVDDVSSVVSFFI